MSTFGENLRKLRRDEKLSGQELAEIITLKGKKITKHAISGYECGKNCPDIETLILFCDYFNVSADSLIGLSQNSNKVIKIAEKMSKIPEYSEESLFKILTSLNDILNYSVAEFKGNSTPQESSILYQNKLSLKIHEAICDMKYKYLENKQKNEPLTIHELVSHTTSAIEYGNVLTDLDNK